MTEMTGMAEVKGVDEGRLARLGMTRMTGDNRDV